jgi:hypothetical protein
MSAPQNRHVRRGYSTAFVMVDGKMREKAPFTLRKDGVAGRAFFLAHCDAVAWKRELWKACRIKTKVVPVEVTMRIVQPKRRARKAAKKR